MKEKIKTIVTEILATSKEITDSSNFVDDFGADSIDQVEIVMALEEEYSIEIPDEDICKISTINSIVEYIQAKTNDA